MEVLLGTGTTSTIINAISDALIIVTGYGLIRSLNAYGRRKLYQRGKVNMNLHFHETTIIPALQNAFRLRKSSHAIVVLFCIQAAICALTLVLKTVAPIGVSQSENFRVGRNRTSEGEVVCLESDPSYPLAHLGEALRRVITHFESGGDIISVGRTGKKSDALIMKDENRSYGLPFVVNEFSKSIPIYTSAPVGGANVSIDVLEVLGKDRSNRSEVVHDVEYSFKRLTYPEVGVQLTEGPFYAVYLFPGVRRETYGFVRCDVPTLRLEHGESKVVRGGCDVANLQRDTTKAGTMKTVAPVASLLEELDDAYELLNMSMLGQRWIMVFDLAMTLTQKKACGDSYVSYHPYSVVSTKSIVILCVLASVALASLVAALVSFVHTRNTFNWNGSYERVINLAAHSDAIQLESFWDIATVPDANVVIEYANGAEVCYHVQVVPKGCASNPVPRANIKLIK